MLFACGGDAPLRSAPAPATRDLTTSALHFPGDSPLAQFVPKGKPAQLTGPLGKLRIGLAEADARVTVDAIASRLRRLPEFAPGPGVIGIGGLLDGFDDISFVVLLHDGLIVALDVSAPLGMWDGVLETAWGPAVAGRLEAGNPTARWEDPAKNLRVTFVNAGVGKADVKWEAIDPKLPVPVSPSQ